MLLLCGAVFVGGVAGEDVTPTSQKITFIGNGGDGSMEAQDIPTGSGDVTVQLNPCAFTRTDGQKFIGWKKGDSAIYYTDRQSIKITSGEATSGIVLTAQWASVTEVSAISQINPPITDQKYYKLTSNVTGNITVNSGGLAVLDLNGCVLQASSGSVITVSPGGVLMVVDSSTGKYHYFKVQDAGKPWTLDDNQTAGTPLDQITDASQLVKDLVIKVTGGCITGATTAATAAVCMSTVITPITPPAAHSP